ncbi:MAG: hypothetical protein ABR557_09525 [Pyrinomonadaceae bacterium]
MSENETAIDGTTSAEPGANTNENAATSAVANEDGAPAAEAAPAEEISYHAVEKDGVVTAIWEMQGRKHMRTIDPRSRQGQDILRLYTTEHHDETAPAEASEAASS